MGRDLWSLRHPLDGWTNARSSPRRDLSQSRAVVDAERRTLHRFQPGGTHSDDRHAKRSDVRLLLWMVVEILKAPAGREVEHALAPLANGGQRAQIFGGEVGLDDHRYLFIYLLSGIYLFIFQLFM